MSDEVEMTAKGGILIRGAQSLALTGVGGITLVGNAIWRFTDFRASFTQAYLKGTGGIPWGDVLIPYVASLCTGKSDYEALRPWQGESWVAKALRVDRVGSPETVRQHLDNLADGHLKEALALVGQANLDLLRRSNAPITPCKTGHVCLDVDTTPQDNGKTKKEGVTRTYMPDVFGFAPIFACAGEEGWCINDEFRIGKQHGQKGAPAFLKESIQRLRDLGVASILARLDSAFDAAENFLLFREEGVDFLVKGNPSHMRWPKWQEEAEALPKNAWKSVGRNLRVAYLSREETREFDDKLIPVRRVLKVTKKLAWTLKDVPPGHRLLIKRYMVYESESWVTSLAMSGDSTRELYCQHATAEQYHSEFKSELDLERMPSGNFKTNALILRLGTFAYNVLRLLGILGKDVMAYRHPAKRRRMRTIIQEMIMVPARVLTGSGQLKLDIGSDLPGRSAFLALHKSLAASLDE
jgi:hypothetical protein